MHSLLEGKCGSSFSHSWESMSPFDRFYSFCPSCYEVGTGPGTRYLKTDRVPDGPVLWMRRVSERISEGG